MNKKKIIYLALISFMIITIFVIILIRSNDMDNETTQDVNIYSNVNNNYTTDNNVEDNNYDNTKSTYYNNPIIPEGFTKVETETASWKLDECNNPIGWNDGLVIEDTKGNQFVWIPVKDLNSFEKKEGYYEGKQQEFLNNCYEADNINTTTESEELYKSVQKYQGFYIARYEAGIEDFSKRHTTNGSIHPISKKGAIVWKGVRWGSSYDYALDGVQGSDTANGAVKVARSMYPNVDKLSTFGLPSNLTNDTGVISTLCYGVQWDLVMEFISDIENPYTNTKYIEDSTNMGYYAKQSVQLTGTDIENTPNNSVKNIYDLAGNVYEWTMEAYKNKYRICRGGMYEMGNNAKASASMRAYSLPDHSENIYLMGFRVALYIK